MKKVSKFINVSLILMLIASLAFATGCKKEEKSNSETLVLTVDDSKVYLDEMMYHIMLAEMQGQLYASFVEGEENYWDILNDDGSTIGEASKDLAIQNAIKYELFYQLAIKEGYTLTEEEKEISKSQADNIIKSVEPTQFQSTELTEEKLLQIQEKIAIGIRYYNDYLIKLGVDEEAIKAKIPTADYKQYDIQYIFAGEQQYDDLKSLLEIAKTTEDLTTLTNDTNLTSGNLSFLEGAGTFGEETNLEDVIKAMAVDEVSDIVETVKGHYIIKLTDNKSTKLYDAAVRKELEKAVTEVFEPAYDALKQDHKIKIVNKVWDPIKMGSTTISSKEKESN